MRDKIKKVGLVAGISGKELTTELKTLGVEVYLIGGRPDESGYDIADQFFCVDLKEKEDIAKYLKNNNVKYIVLGTGHKLAFDLARYLEAEGFIISVDTKASDIAKNKAEFKKKLESFGYLTPAFIQLDGNLTKIDDIISEVGIPCVVKCAVDSILPQKANTKAELEMAINELKEKNSQIIIEQFIDGVDCTIPVIANYDDIKPVIFSYYNKSKSCKLKGFDVLKTDEPRLEDEIENDVLEYSKNIIKDIGIIGLCRLDIIVKNDKYYVLECNSVIVTGVHPNQIEYGRYFIEKEQINFAKLLVDNALEIFHQKER